MAEGYSAIEGGGVQRTDLSCHSCSRQFVAELDLDVEGDYIIECPFCGHQHYRKVIGGKITESRWGQDSSADRSRLLSPRSVWKSSVIKAQTSTVSHFLRERWINRSDIRA